MAKKKFSFIDELHTRLMKSVSITRAGEARLKRSDLKKTLEDAFVAGVKAAAGGERVRFPVIGVLARKDVKARKAGKGTNPFTGEPMTIKARPASKKPRWSFPKSVKEVYAKKSNW
ncbi:MAG: HU family DNA-binding protein [Bdellovibrionota bacterium]